MRRSRSSEAQSLKIATQVRKSSTSNSRQSPLLQHTTLVMGLAGPRKYTHTHPISLPIHNTNYKPTAKLKSPTTQTTLNGPNPPPASATKYSPPKAGHLAKLSESKALHTPPTTRQPVAHISAYCCVMTTSD